MEKKNWAAKGVARGMPSRLDWKGQPIRNLRSERGEPGGENSLVFHRDFLSLFLPPFFYFPPAFLPAKHPPPAYTQPLFAFQGTREGKRENEKETGSQYQRCLIPPDPLDSCSLRRRLDINWRINGLEILMKY